MTLRFDVAEMSQKVRNAGARFIDNLSIRSKLFGYALLLITLILILAGFVLYQVGKIRNQYVPARAAAREVEAAVLTMRTHELNFINEADSPNAEFYLKNKSPNIDAWQQNYRQFEKNYARLVQLSGGTDISRELKVVESQIVKYRDTFLALNGTYRERGFQSFGREGVLQERADSLRTSLAGNDALLTLFLNAQEAQNKFLLYQEILFISQFHEHTAKLESQLKRLEDKNLLNEYVRIFDDVVAINQKIGLTSSAGLRGELNQLTKNIMPHIQTIEVLVLNSTSASITSIARYIIVITILLIITAVLLAFVLARLIIGKIALLSAASQQIASGNLQYRLPMNTVDELGRLSASFNAMAEELQAGRSKLRERAYDLSQSVKRFELVSHVLNEAIYDWDIRSGKLTWGDGIVSVFGYEPHNKKTTIDWWAQHIHSEDADSINDSLASLIKRRAENWKKEYRFKRASGEYAYCQDRGFIEYRRGEPVRMVGSIVDISRQKALDRAKDEFISVASHQLRTPLGSIRWNLELLLEKKHSLTKETGEYAQEAYDSTLRMAALVNDLLSVARIEQDRVQHIPEKSDLVEIALAAVTEMRPIANRNNVHLNTADLNDKHIYLFIDPKRFREVIQNVLSNAVKYTPAKGTVSVAIEQRSKDFVVSVSDNGIGIPIEDQTKLFGKFYRATNVTTTDTEGSGLGLFVVKSYVETWGGRVWFTSKMNQGTTFYISIPHKPRIPK